MQLPDGSVLMHGNAPYDPVKAHEYYMRTRHLKGRRKGGSFTVTEANGKTVKLSAQQLAEQKAYAAHRVSQIKKNLADLNVILRNKLEEAQASAAKKDKPPTLAEKAQAARDAEKYRQTHKQELKNKATQQAAKQRSSGSSSSSSSSSQPKSDTVDSVKADIKKTRDNLKAAVAKQRELATAKKNG